MRKIPTNFNYRKESLDSSETFIRDRLKLKIENWAKFRYVIHVGTNSRFLQPKPNKKKVLNEVKESYRELGKSHYEVVTSLGSIKLILKRLETIYTEYKKSRKSEFLLLFQTDAKNFYFHIGCLLDNLARLIYIINDPSAPTKKGGKGSEYKRHYIGWGDLKHVIEKNGNLKCYKGYRNFFRSRRLNEIRNIRNGVTHSWKFPFSLTKDGEIVWPIIIRKKKFLLWPYEPYGKRYKKGRYALEMMKEDFDFIEKFQENIFEKLIKDVKKFERNHNVIIV